MQGGLGAKHRLGIHEWLELLALLLPVIIAVPLYVHLCSKQGMLPGIDGPYYAVQVVSIDRTGTLKYPDPPLIFYIMYAFYKLSGSVFTGVRLGASLMMALSSIPLYILARRLTGSSIAALSSSVAFLAAPFEVRLLGDFLKNASGLLWVSLYILALYEASRGRWSRLRATAYLLALTLLAGLTHILDYGFIAVLTVVFISAQMLRGRFMVEAAAALTISIIIFYSAPMLQGGDLGKAFRLAEEGVSGGEAKRGAKPLRHVGRPPAPHGGVAEIMKWLNILTVILLLMAALATRGLERMLLASIAVSLALLTLPPYGGGVSWRLQLMGGIPVAMAIGVIVGASGREQNAAMVGAALVGLIMLLGLYEAGFVAPSITPQAYNELKHALSTINSKCIVIRDPRLRYWAETISSNIHKTPEPGCGPPVIMDFNYRAPLRARYVYRGLYISAWMPG